MRPEFSNDEVAGSVQALPVTASVISAPLGLTATAQAGGGSFAAGTYYWKVTFVTPAGETTGSVEASAAIALNGSCNLAWSPPPPSVTNVKVYRGTSSGGENVVVATLGPVAAYTDTGAAGSAATVPTTNTATQTPLVIMTGEALYFGFSFRETSGTNNAKAELVDGGNPIDESRVPQGADEHVWLGPNGVHVKEQIAVNVITGVFTGCIYAKYRHTGETR